MLYYKLILPQSAPLAGGLDEKGGGRTMKYQRWKVSQGAPEARQALEDVGDERAVYLPFMPPISEEAGEVGACGHPNLKAHRRFADILIRQVAELTGWQ